MAEWFSNYCVLLRYPEHALHHLTEVITHIYRQHSLVIGACYNDGLFQLFVLWKKRFPLIHVQRYIRGAESQLHSLTSTQDRGEWITIYLGRFITGKAHRYPLYRRLGGPQSRSGRSVEQSSFFPYWISNPWPSNAYPSYHASYATLTHYLFCVFLNYSSTFFTVQQPNSGISRLTLEVSRTHTVRHTNTAAIIWTSEQLVVEAAPYPTSNKLTRWISIPSAVFEPASPAIKRPQTHALDLTVNTIGCILLGWVISSCFYYSDHTTLMVGWVVNGELDRVRNEWAVDYSVKCLEKLGRNTKKLGSIINDPTNIRSRSLLNTSTEFFCWISRSLLALLVT